MRRSYNSKSLAHLIVLSPDNLACRKIDQFHVSFRIYHEVFRLDIPANYLIIIEVFQDQYDTSPVKLTIFRRKQTNAS